MSLLIGDRYRRTLQKPLDTRGVSVLWLPDNPDLDIRLAGHADLSVFLPQAGIAIVAEGIYAYIVNYLTNRGYRVVSSGEQGKKYPMDAGLCICATGKYTIYDPKTAAAAAAPFLTGIRVAVPQGYTKCSVCVVSPDSIITSDDAVSRQAAAAGMDVLQIKPGYIILEGFGYGFIGGASFLLDEKHLAFTGSLDRHPDRDAVFAFLNKHGVEPVFLTDEPIFDIGGAAALP